MNDPRFDGVGEDVVAEGVERRRQRWQRAGGGRRHRRPTVAVAAGNSFDAMFSLDQLRIFTEPQQGATYDELLAVARRAEQLGFGAFFRSDHYLAMGGALEAGGLPGPTDAWTTLAGLARETATIRLGTHGHLGDVPPARPAGHHRRPGRRRCRAAASSSASAPGGTSRSTWRYGIPFPPLGERFDRLEEQLAVITGLWSTPVGERFSYDGRHYRVADSPALPKPVQEGGVPVIVGGGGPKRTPALAARYAAEYNTPFMSVERFAEQQAARRRGVRGDRARPGVAALHGGRRRLPRRRRGGVRTPRRGDRSPARRAAPERRRRHARRGRRRAPTVVRRRRRADVSPGARPRPTSTTSTPSPPSAAAESDASGGHMEHRRIETRDDRCKSLPPRSILAPYGCKAGAERPNERRSQGRPRPGSIRGPCRARVPRCAARQQAKAGPQANP